MKPHRALLLPFFCFLLAALPAAGAATGPQVRVVVGERPSALERFAAEELAGLLRTLFGAETRLAGPGSPAGTETVILLGSPTTNAAVAAAAGKEWPKLSEQGHTLRSVTHAGRPALVVGGGSPVATLWAVYELGYRFGVRYSLQGDLLPAVKPALRVEGFREVLEPAQRLRAWRTLGAAPAGPEAWGLEDQKRLLRQLARLKFNRVEIEVHPWQPFVHWEARGLRKESALLLRGRRYGIDADTPGRAAFRGATLFTNPDLAGKEGYEERIAAGKALVGGIIDTAHSLGMTAALAFAPLEFPREFAPALPGAEASGGAERLAVGPGPGQGPDDPALRELAKAQFRAYLAAYPTLDALSLTLPAAGWGDHAEAAWRRLATRGGIGGEITLERLTQEARGRSPGVSGGRGIQSLHGSVAALDFLQTLAAEPGLLQVNGRRLEVNVAQVDPALFPFLERLLPKDAGTVLSLAPSARGAVEQVELLRRVPRRVRSTLMLPLADDSSGVLPQMATGHLHRLLGALRGAGWTGLVAAAHLPGDQSPTTHYLSRAAFDPTVTPASAGEDFLDTPGGAGVAGPVLKGFALVEQAADLIDRSEPGFASPHPNMVTKFYSEAPPTSWWKEARDLYTAASSEMYRGNQRAAPPARPLLQYYAKRLEFGIGYLNSLEALRLAGAARVRGNREEQVGHLERAAEAIYNALNTLGEVARDPSDRGVIALLTEHGYRPLVKAMEAADGACGR